AVAWGGAAADVGRVRHSSDATLATAANEVVFDGPGLRRPYMVRFRTTGLNPTDFDVFSRHAAPDSDYPSNANGIRNFADVYSIGEGRATPTLITGDFNCCPMNPCPNKPAGHHAAEVAAQDRLTGTLAVHYAHNDDAREVMLAAAEAGDQAEVAAATPPPPV